MPAGETGTIRKVAFAVEGSAIPTLPAPGSNITYADPWLTTIGGQPGASDDAYLAEDDVEITPLYEGIPINPPLAQNKLGEIVIKNAIEMVKFGVYSMKQAVLALSSTATSSSNAVTEGTTITYKAMVIEYTGIGILYFPRVQVKLVTPQGAVKSLASNVIECMVEGTNSFPSGYAWYTFNG